jgi:hypothetical protein
MPVPPPLEMSQSIEEFERQNKPRGNFPNPGAAPEVPQDPFPEEPLQYFESIGPVNETIVWNGVRIPVQFMLLDIAEEKSLIDAVADIPGPQQIVSERQARIAQALYSVNGKRVVFSSDYITDQIERVNWVERFKGPLLFVLSQAYERAFSQPLIELGKFQANPK